MEKNSLRQITREKGPRTPVPSRVSVGGAKAALAIIVVFGLALLLLILFQHFGI
jgi:hypothetical protein